MIVNNGTGTDGTWDYIDGIVYHNGVLSFIATEEGRAERKTDGTYNYEYNLKDPPPVQASCLNPNIM